MLLLIVLGTLGLQTHAPAAGGSAWTAHTVYEGQATSTAVAADFTGDGRPDVISSSAGKVRLFIAPGWSETPIYNFPSDRQICIHSTFLDVDGDGDPDYLGAHAKGAVFWLENPDRPESDPWNCRVVDGAFNGIHCLLAGDIDSDGRPELIVNNFEPVGAYADSILWFPVPRDPLGLSTPWQGHPFARTDARGGSHYMGLGDIDGDGLPDITCAAKGEPFLDGNWFAWWKNPGPAEITGPWKKFVVSTGEPGATNLHPADLNGDGRTDLLASRGHGSGVLWFEQDGSNWKAHDIDPGIEGPHCLLAADFDEDGDIDGATCAKDSQLVMFYENDSRGNFTNHILGTGQAAYDIRAVDMDGDSDLDLLIAGQRSANVVWYENPLRGAKTSLEVSPAN